MLNKLFKEIKLKLIEYKYLILLCAIIVLLFGIKLPYYIKIPGGLINTSDRIDTNLKIDITGSMNMAYVSEIKATIPTYIISKFNNNWDLVEIKNVVSKNETTEEKDYRNTMLLNEANSVAEIIAYKKAGKHINIENSKMNIIYIDNEAITNLKIKDEILKVDKIEVKNLDDIKKIINTHNINDIIEIETNNGIKTAKVIESNNSKVIGIMISNTYELNTDIKFTFNNKESGPSGGMIMSLSIYNYLTNDSLTRGRKIVGTGTINLNGEVGEIDGIKYKLMGAVKNKADIFLVPYENYDEAKQVKEKNKYDIIIYPVGTIDEAIEVLKKE